MNPSPARLLSLNELRTAVRPICESHPVARLEVFGSRAAGAAPAESDVDLLVDFLPEANPGLFENPWSPMGANAGGAASSPELL